MTEEDEAFEELAKRQGDWGLQGSRKHQIMRYLENDAMREVQRLGQEIEQEPVAWLLTEKNSNQLQVDAIQRLIDRAKHAHMTDIKLRIGGQDEWFQADWLKHMVRATPPQRTWVGLTNKERAECWETIPELAMQKVEAKLKEKNT